MLQSSKIYSNNINMTDKGILQLNCHLLINISVQSAVNVLSHVNILLLELDHNFHLFRMLKCTFQGILLLLSLACSN